MGDISLALIEEPSFDESTRLLDRILEDNRQAPSLQALCRQAQRGEDSELTLEDRLLLYSRRLIVSSVTL